MSLAQLLQVVGAVVVLVPFAGSQLCRMRADGQAYLWLNVLGSGLLAALALADRQWGFLLLEACWGLVAARGLVRPRAA
ncbi:hypothetical protein FSW04_22965 [Baekduia soli]|uniref:CBU-0592-like domain-containing protein n=1 Tax=Baekduia soli TaxID=496014 RepID=A0A5B8UAD6_9ACTN|nr:hypothetical protein [Baekduia soli]QEC50153.1 hypothetical protein FSW04_22965 [Baekduia soli]